MSVTIARAPSAHLVEGQRTWDTFEDDRPWLYDQYLDVPYAAETGLAPEALQAEIARCLAGLADRSHALQKAHAFRLILTRAQVHVDPFDWFPDKFNHAGLLSALRHGWHDEARAGALAADAAWFEALHATGLGRGVLDTGHISPGWGRMFSLGLEGIAAEAERYLSGCAADEGERRDFYFTIMHNQTKCHLFGFSE